MSQSHIPAGLRERVAVQARHRCGYCLTAATVVGTPMEIDHLVPETLGGKTEEDNLWLACAQCNARKADRIVCREPLTGEMVPLFNPRHQAWSEHFRWSEEADQIVGLTPSGRATVLALQLNRPVLVSARRAWVSVGWHPPQE